MGMRALGIPNNKNFYEVTQIAEAQALWANIQVSGQIADRPILAMPKQSLAAW